MVEAERVVSVTARTQVRTKVAAKLRRPLSVWYNNDLKC